MALSGNLSAPARTVANWPVTCRLPRLHAQEPAASDAVTQPAIGSAALLSYASR